MRNRKHYTHTEAQTVLKDWLRANRLGTTQFSRWLEARGVTASKQYIHQLVTGALHPGPKFKQIFKEITGITLVDGLVERREQ